MTRWESTATELWMGDKGIAFFVHSGMFYWVFDEKFNFSLDAEREYRAYLDKGHINRKQYDAACLSFRGGILKLTADNFLDYLYSGEEKILSSQELKEVLGHGLDLDGELHQSIEKYYLFGGDLSKDGFSGANIIASRLPKFYVNFDRKIYIHMDFGRAHEDLVYADWFAGCEDFCYLIPDRERYWFLHGSDYWKLRFLQSN
ncbi:hypothetical protein [Achromobacter sp. GD03932]|uniref:hypothetical protein n=1 Tax=Achromobacter sp. GD03932 TaxID=2975407 RepID=UPI00244D426C|nr:hypothetical protein [Achromobacter sp. GD03932]MDH1300253.1 hypothetical protein [Achromobacter sp. GD03932]